MYDHQETNLLSSIKSTVSVERQAKFRTGNILWNLLHLITSVSFGKRIQPRKPFSEPISLKTLKSILCFSCNVLKTTEAKSHFVNAGVQLTT